MDRRRRGIHLTVSALLGLSLLLAGFTFGEQPVFTGDAPELRVEEPEHEWIADEDGTRAVLLSAEEAKSGELTIPAPTRLELAMERSYALGLAETAAGSERFAAQPSAASPYAAGALTEEYLRSGLAWLNYIRYAAGLRPASQDSGWNEAAQYGAVVLAANDQLTHYPSQPEDMDDDFFKRGAAATSSSNISMRWGYGNVNQLVSALNGCMSDNSPSNMPMLGHRRWLINPLKDMKVGFGEAYAARGSVYVDTKVFDGYVNYTQNMADYDFIAWPAAGNFPAELLSVSDPWSVTLNPLNYAVPRADQVAVSITRQSDGTSWTLDNGSYTGSPVNTSPYFTVNSGGYGVSNCIIFHPGSRNWGVDAFDGRYDVRITGLTDRSGNPVELSYAVDFFDAAAVELPVYTVSVEKSAGGDVSASSQQVTAGRSVTFTVTPDEGFELVMVSVDGTAQPLQSSYTIEKISADTEVLVLFADSADRSVSDGTFRYSLNGTALTVIGTESVSAGGALQIPEAFLGMPVTAIGESAFENCRAGSLSIPDSVTDIGEKAFYGGSFAGTFRLPGNLKSLGRYACAYLSAVTGFEVAEGEGGYRAEDGVLFEQGTGGTRTLLNYPLASAREAYIVPSDVTLLYCTSFAQAKHLNAVYAAGQTLQAMTYTFWDDTLTFYGRPGTYLASQISGGSLEGSVQFRDLSQEALFSLEQSGSAGKLRVINLTGETLRDTLLIAFYRDGRLSSCSPVPLNVAPDQIVWLATDGSYEAGVSIRFFYVGVESFVPLLPALDQPAGVQE